jgi:hypothetical protein
LQSEPQLLRHPFISASFFYRKGGEGAQRLSVINPSFLEKERMRANGVTEV